MQQAHLCKSLGILLVATRSIVHYCLNARWPQMKPLTFKLMILPQLESLERMLLHEWGSRFGLADHLFLSNTCYSTCILLTAVEVGANNPTSSSSSWLSDFYSGPMHFALAQRSKIETCCGVSSCQEALVAVNGTDAVLMHLKVKPNGNSLNRKGQECDRLFLSACYDPLQAIPFWAGRRRIVGSLK